METITNYTLNKEDSQVLMLALEKAIQSSTGNKQAEFSRLRGNIGNQYYEQNQTLPTGSHSIEIEAGNPKLTEVEPNQFSKL